MHPLGWCPARLRILVPGAPKMKAATWPATLAMWPVLDLLEHFQIFATSRKDHTALFFLTFLQLQSRFATEFLIMERRVVRF